MRRLTVVVAAALLLGTGSAYAQGSGSTGGTTPSYGQGSVSEPSAPQTDYSGSGTDQNGVQRSISADGVARPNSAPGTRWSSVSSSGFTPTPHRQDRSTELGG